MTDTATLKRYHSIIKPYLGLFLFAILFDVVMTALGLAIPLFMRVLFDYAYPLRSLELLNVTVVAIIVAYFIYFFLSVASDYLQIFITQEASAALSEKIFHAIQCLPLKFHMEKRPGDLLIRLTDDVAKTVQMVTSVLPTFIIDGGRLVIILAIAFYINTKLTLLALLSIPLYVLEAKFYATRLAKVEGQAIDADSKIVDRAQEKLLGIRTIKAFGQERNETLSFGQLIRHRYRIGLRARFLEVVRTFTNSITLQMWSVFLTWYLGFLLVKGSLTIGEIIALMLYLEQLESPIRSFINLFTEWKTNLVSMDRLSEVLDHPKEDIESPKGKDLKVGAGSVTASKLSFEYAPNNEVLHAIDVRFMPRNVSAIVGASGGGKTTLLNLMLRFFEPSKGMILVDGQNISEVRVSELRGKMGLVSQESTIFDGTIMDNILYGSEGLERGDAMRAARMAGAHDFIEKLPGGYDAAVGMTGELLSGGQKQRIAIARTLLKDPSVVIFDEATSALDAESEYKIQEVIANLKQTKTVVVVAHRLSTVKSADRVFVLEDGRFVEEGTFEDLLEKRGAFYRYYWRQFGGLKTFRQQLEVELERSSRYGSKFCLATMRLATFEKISEKAGPVAAERFVDQIDFLLKKSMRIGDNSAVLGGNTILMLLPEISIDQMKQFFARMMKHLPRTSDEELMFDLNARDIMFAGTRVTKRSFKTPEELISALVSASRTGMAGCGYFLVDEDEITRENME